MKRNAGMKAGLGAGLLVLVLCGGWGFKMHRLINSRACFNLPPEMLGFFKQHEAEIARLATAPDERRKLIKDEAPRHYIDLDLWPEAERYHLPHAWDEAMARYSLDTLMARGIVPWQVQATATKLARAMEARAVDSIIHYAADLGHYIADAHVPFHTTANYDGQLTGQRGIHSLYETKVPTLFADTMHFFAGPVHHMASIGDSIWPAIHAAHALLPQALAAHQQVFGQPSGDSIAPGYTGPSQVASQAQIAAYHALLGNTVQVQAQRSAAFLASAWFTCWVNAGQPDLRYTTCGCRISTRRSLSNALRKLNHRLFHHEPV